MVSIKLQNVWLKYRIEFKESGRVTHEDFWGLKDISFEVRQGEALGIIGENGAGKSTLLRIIGGMLKPDHGAFEIHGRVAGLVDLGGGFQKDLTGKENIYLISSLFGLSKKQAETRYDDIVKFAAIGRFINAPVKCYSQGMLMRLGFAIAIHVDPDILLLDDSYVVGDIYAQNKCSDKLFELRDQGKTILFVSHDLSIVRRICSRGLFLREGGIIKDSSIDKVCDYYSETVGDKKGIVLLEQGLSGLVFNNGRLIIRWKDGAITTQIGGHCAMKLLDREYASTLADWQIERVNGPDGKGIIATGSWLDIPVLQRWKLFFLNAEELIWEITIESLEDALPTSCQTVIIFQDGYKHWFTVNDKKAFAKAFLHGEDWQIEPVDDALNAVVGLRGDNAQGALLPVVIFDRLRNNQQLSCHIGNTGSVVGARALNYTVFPRGIDSERPPFKRTIFYSKVMLFDPSQTERIAEFLDNSRKLMRDSIFVNNGPLSVFCRDREIGIYWNEMLITRNAGFNTQFKYQDKSYSAIDGNWSISKENSQEIRVVVSWDGISGFRQIWCIEIKDDNTLAWEITLETDEERKIIYRRAELLLSKEYLGWFTAEEAGQFDRMEKRGGAVILDKYTNNCVGVEGSGNKEDVTLPEVSFCCDSNIPVVSYISKDSGELSFGIRLQYLEIDSKERAYIRSGKKRLFNGVIHIAASSIRKPEDKLKKNQYPAFADNDPGAIHHDKLSLILDHGKGRIIWDGLELTKGLGLYSSVFLQERWHDSSQARWEISRTDARKLVAVGQWPWVPMKQIWEIHLLDARTIIIKISKEIWDEEVFTAEREQVGLMVENNYGEWFSPRQIKAKFPADFIEHSGIFWERLWCGNGSSCIGVGKGLLKKGLFKRKRIPSLLFESFPDCQPRHAIVENTDDLFQARVLQYEMAPSGRCEIGTSVHFYGKIKIIT